MRNKKFSLIIALLFSVCAVYAQSTVKVTVKNNTAHAYTCSVKFNQNVTPNGSSTPSTATTFTVAQYSTEVYTYEFDEYDVNLDAIKCAWVQGGTEIADISVSSGTGTSDDVSPMISAGPPPTYYKLYFTTYSGSGTFEHSTFTIDQ